MSCFEALCRDLGGEAGVVLGGGGRGFGSDALRFEGRIFAMTRRGGLVLKLPASRVDELIRAGTGVPFDAGKGRPMREWVVVTPSAGAEWRALAEEALRFVRSGC